MPGTGKPPNTIRHTKKTQRTTTPRIITTRPPSTRCRSRRKLRAEEGVGAELDRQEGGGTHHYLSCHPPFAAGTVTDKIAMLEGVLSGLLITSD